jgi:molybdenum cofactor cytidylyltransferase
MKDVTGLWTVILAAGGSTRLGSAKQLLRYRGQTAIARTIGLAQALTPNRVAVVVGAEALRVRGAARREPGRLRIARNPRWREGMSRSLRLGLAALPRQAEAALVLVVDQPLVTEGDLVRLVDAWSRRPGRPAAAAYAGRLGIPAILPRRSWLRASRAGGDVGAREILRDPLMHVTAIPMATAAFDVDTREDLEKR